MLNWLSLANVMVMDIETVPQHADYEQLSTEMQELWDKKTQHSRGEDTSAKAFYHRAGIWAEFGKIICISMGVVDTQNKKHSLRIKSIYGHNEKEILGSFSDLLQKQSKKLLLCAHNGKEFDFPYLCRRLMINRLPIPDILQIAGKKPWEVRHVDTMDLWKFGDYKHYTSLNLLATILNIPTPKDDIDGGQVAEIYYQHNDIERIARYCEKDVATTAQILLSFKGLPNIPESEIIFLPK